MEENDRLPVEKGLASKIYGLAFKDPQSGYSLAQQIGSQPHHVNAKIKELYKQKYLLKIEKKEWKYPRWQSNPETLIIKIEQIKQKENITFTELDKQVLIERFNNYFFKQFFHSSFRRELIINPNPNAIDQILSVFETVTRLMEQFSDYIEECQKIITVKDYQEMIQKQKDSLKDFYGKLKLKKIADIIKDDEIPKFHKYLEDNLGEKIEFSKVKNMITDFRESEQLKKFDTNMFEKTQKQIGDKTDIENFFITSFFTPIPKHLFENYKGISSWGRKYNELEEMIQLFMKMKLIDILQSIDNKEKQSYF